jgi:hypothetical protein
MTATLTPDFHAPLNQCNNGARISRVGFQPLPFLMKTFVEAARCTIELMERQSQSCVLVWGSTVRPGEACSTRLFALNKVAPEVTKRILQKGHEETRETEGPVRCVVQAR